MRKDGNLENLVAKIKDGLEELRGAFSGIIDEFKNRILIELGVPPGRSSSNMEELNKRALKIRGISGENRMESFIFQISEISLNNEDFQKLAWLILSKPIKNWIDQDVDKLMVEATRFAREFRNLETMASIKDRDETSYSFALVNHNKGRENNLSTKVFELNEEEFKSANNLVLKLKKLTKQGDKNINNKTILAALSILSDEKDGN